jgi:Carbohydrate phosphorylase
MTLFWVVRRHRQIIVQRKHRNSALATTNAVPAVNRCIGVSEGFIVDPLGATVKRECNDKAIGKLLTNVRLAWPELPNFRHFPNCRQTAGGGGGVVIHAEAGDNWLRRPDPWEVARPYETVDVKLDIFSDHFSRNEPGVFAPLRDTLLTHGDHYMHLADLKSYLEADQRLVELYADLEGWARKAALNVANSGKFSSDRTIAEYAADIWNAKPCPVL